MAVTVRMLLNHASRIADYQAALFPSARAVVDGRGKAYTPQDLVMCGLQMTGRIMPGEMYVYSDTDYVILGCLIEQVAGRRYEEEVERRLLRPPRLEETYLCGVDPRIRGSHTTAYVPAGATFCDVTDYNMSDAWAAGALVSTAHDILGALWGHDGYAPGHAAFAWNSQDGRTAQLFQAENLTWYAGPYGDPANPIDTARTAFQLAACS